MINKKSDEHNFRKQDTLTSMFLWTRSFTWVTCGMISLINGPLYKQFRGTINLEKLGIWKPLMFASLVSVGTIGLELFFRKYKISLQPKKTGHGDGEVISTPKEQYDHSAHRHMGNSHRARHSHTPIGISEDDGLDMQNTYSHNHSSGHYFSGSNIIFMRRSRCGSIAYAQKANYQQMADREQIFIIDDDDKDKRQFTSYSSSSK